MGFLDIVGIVAILGLWEIHSRLKQILYELEKLNAKPGRPCHWEELAHQQSQQAPWGER